MHDLPCVTVFSDFQNPEIIVKKILDCDELPEFVSLESNTKGYPWLINTKYYQTHVHICPVQQGESIPDKIVQNTEGLVLYFDCENNSSFDKVKQFVDETDICPEVLLLVCDSFKNVKSEGVTRSVATNWCLENGYELIELYNDEVVEDNDYDIIPEKKGFERIVEALQAHTWSNLEMKSGDTHKPHTASTDALIDDDTDEFCELFSQLQGMKESLQSLPPSERRMCAEQVVATFWKAIGGDENEIDDILDENTS